MTAEGPVARSLDEELADITALFHSAAAVAGHELGMAPASDSDASRFRQWAKAPDVAQDISLHVSFDTSPTADMLAGNVRVEFSSTNREVAYDPDYRFLGLAGRISTRLGRLRPG